MRSRRQTAGRQPIHVRADAAEIFSPSLVKVECLITEVDGMRLAGSVAVISGQDDLLEAFENVPPFTRQEIDDYAAGLRESHAIFEIERAYGT